LNAYQGLRLIGSFSGEMMTLNSFALILFATIQACSGEFIAEMHVAEIPGAAGLQFNFASRSGFVATPGIERDEHPSDE
jgi:hypothetical protein